MRQGVLCAIPDVGALFSVSAVPSESVPLLFWRADNDTICLRKCLLFNRDMGLTPNTAVSKDLHPHKPFGSDAGVSPIRGMGVLAQRYCGSGCIEQNGELQKLQFWVFGPGCGHGMRPSDWATATKTWLSFSTFLQVYSAIWKKPN